MSISRTSGEWQAHAPSQGVAQQVSEEESAALLRLAQQALARARERGQPVLTGWSAAWDGPEPLQVAAHCAGLPGPRFYWEQPAEALALAAGGAAARFTAEGPGRFSQVARAVRRALDSACWSSGDPTLPQGPYLTGGFSFFDGLDAAQWPGYAPADLTAPTWLLMRQEGQGTLLVSTRAEPEEEAHAIAGRLSDMLGEVRGRAAGDAPTFQPGGSWGPLAIDERGDDRAHYMDLVSRARERIRAGDLRKVVLSRALDVRCGRTPDPWAMLAHLRRHYPECHTFLVQPADAPALLGATPERLVRLFPGRLQTAALASTVPRGKDDAEDARLAQRLATGKEQEEHQLVVEGIVAALADLGELQRPATPQVVRLPNLQHLKTPITVQLREAVAPLAVLERLHPTPAVGGHPRERAFAVIRALESYDRGWYAAPVGWLNAAGEGDFAVALRVGLLDGTRMRLFAGGGIMADSDPAREFEETGIKFRPLLTTLAHE